MKITVITYKQSTSSGEELSVTAQLLPDDNVDDCFDSLKSFVRRKLYPAFAVADDKRLEDMIAESTSLLKVLGWTNQQGRDHLLKTYGKRSRSLLTSLTI
jgi:mevalonate kinase